MTRFIGYASTGLCLLWVLILFFYFMIICPLWSSAARRERSTVRFTYPNIFIGGSAELRRAAAMSALLSLPDDICLALLGSAAAAAAGRLCITVCG